MSDTQALLSELAHVKALFQLRAIAAHLGFPPVRSASVQTCDATPPRLPADGATAADSPPRVGGLSSEGRG